MEEGNKYTVQYFAYRWNVPVMVNFMCHSGWDTVPRYLVRYSGCFFEGGLGMRLKG